jgi:teichuronic acid biosynthesis glycosyltransferase TuaC
LKILFVSSGNYPTGVSNLAISQARSIIALKIEVDYYFIKGKGIAGYLKNSYRLRKQIKNNKYDLIHAHYGLSYLITLLARKNKERIIVSFMGSDLLGDRAKNGKSTFFGYLLVLANQFFVKYSDHVIVKSNEMYSKIVFEHKSIIPNGVDLIMYYSIDRLVAIKRVGWDPTSKHLLFMSDPSRPEKNFPLLKAALSHLQNEEIQLHYLLNIPEEEVVFYYNASDACLLSSFHEGSPNVIKEALACNCTVVSTDVGDVKWVLGNLDGCFITSFEPEDVAEKIKLAIEFREKNAYTKGRERIIELKLDSKTIAERIIQIYHKVLNC